MVALVIGYLAAVYHSDLHRRKEHYYSSIRDDLTGLLNRRGVMDAVDKSLARHPASYATLLGSVRLLHGGRDKKQAARKGGRGKNHARSHDTSP